MQEGYRNLNPNQQEAVRTINGRLLILAGAGSGKTRVLTVRMAHLISNHQVSPQSILGLTFTNKAAAEMRHRIAQLVAPQLASQVTLCTFHSFCMQILRKEAERLGYTRHFSLYDEYDVSRLITQISRELLNHDSTLPSLAPTISLINKARSQGLLPQELLSAESTWHQEFTQQVYKKFCDSMRAYNAVDFDNLLCLTVQLFEQHPQVLDRYQERYRYLMVDEYQDTNPIQCRLTNLLASKYQNLCVVGDDDQSIYGWRGAEIRSILEFEKAHIIKLEQNYRSTNTILNAANALIKNNTKRHGKQLWSTQGDGEKIEVFHAPTEIQEAEAVVQRLVHLKERAGMHWKDIAILYRSNALSRQMEQALLKHQWQMDSKWYRGVPYRIFGGEEYYERREVKDLMAYLRVMLNPLDQEALLRVINLPRRGIGDESLDKLTSYNRQENLSLWTVLQKICQGVSLPFSLNEKTRQSLHQFMSLLEKTKLRFQQEPLHLVMQDFISEIDFKRSIDEEVKSDKMRNFKWENVQEFVSALTEYEDEMHRLGKQQEISLHDFVINTPLGQESSFHYKKESGADCVNLMTFHSAKGLEFKACFLIGLEDHIIPHEKSLQERGLEEERRLMYVAITRAQKELCCSMARTRKRMGKDMVSRPSRFLSEIPKEFLRITAWDQRLGT